MGFCCFTSDEEAHLLAPESFQERLDRFDEENKRLKSSVDALQGENGRLKASGDQLEASTIALTAEVEKFTEENTRLAENVENFQTQNNKLKDVSDLLAQENEKFGQELESLRGTLEGLDAVKLALENYARDHNLDMTKVIGTLNETLEEQKECVKKQSTLLDQSKEVTGNQEKILLLQLQAQCQFMDGQLDMSPEEFQLFSSMIPYKFRSTPIGLEFDSIDGDKDGRISMREFHDLVDRLVASIP